jgi:hypothetical protein
MLKPGRHVYYPTTSNAVTTKTKTSGGTIKAGTLQYQRVVREPQWYDKNLMTDQNVYSIMKSHATKHHLIFSQNAPMAAKDPLVEIMSQATQIYFRRVVLGMINMERLRSKPAIHEDNICKEAKIVKTTNSSKIEIWDQAKEDLRILINDLENEKIELAHELAQSVSDNAVDTVSSTSSGGGTGNSNSRKKKKYNSSNNLSNMKKQVRKMDQDLRTMSRESMKTTMKDYRSQNIHPDLGVPDVNSTAKLIFGNTEKPNNATMPSYKALQSMRNWISLKRQTSLYQCHYLLSLRS